MKYRKKPVVIEACQWLKNGDHPDDESKPIDNKEPACLTEGKVVRYYRNPDDSGERACEHCSKQMDCHGWIDTLEGGHIVCPGDWIITGVEGEHYPCKPEIFEQTYEAVEPPIQEREQ